MEKILQDKRIVLAILVGLSVLVYANSLNGAFVIDDTATILKNPMIGQAWKNLIAHDFPSFGLSINYLIGGFHPFIYHLTNLLFHIGVVILAYFFLLQIASREVSFLAAAIFAVHPIHVEVVSWISGRPYAVGATFLLASLLFYIAANKKKKYFYYYYSASLASFFLAQFNELKSLTFLFIICLYEICFGKISKNWKKMIPYFALVLLFLGILFQSFQNRIATENPAYAGGPRYYNPFRQIPVALSSYLELFAWPRNLTFYHEDFSTNFFLRVIVTLLLFGSLIYFFRKQRLLFFGFAFFILSLIPTLLPVKIAFVVAERYVYFGSIGLCLVLAWVLVKGLRRYPQVLFMAAGLLIFLLSIRTIIRNRDWQTQKSLWLATTRVSATSSVPWNNLGNAYSGEGNYQLAIKAFQRAIELNPTHLGAHHNLGVAYLRMGDFDQAIVWFKKAMAINPLPQTYNELGLAYFRKGELEEARQAWEKALELDPSAEIVKKNLRLLEKNPQPSP